MKNNSILVLNSGSSSIKFSLFHFETLKLMYTGEIEDVFSASTFCVSSVSDKKKTILLTKSLNENGYDAALNFFFTWLETVQDKSTLAAVGHRIVHGGADFHKPVLIDSDVIAKLTQLIPLAPLHQPNNLEAINIITKKHPTLPQVACFDTSFHRTQEHLATLFAIPRKLTEEGLIRYGFHGISYEYIASILPEKIGDASNKKIIVAHLGSGASMCALRNLKSIATSMGLTALDGLMMGSRCGNIDPGLLLYLLQEKNKTPEQISHLLYSESGLIGVSGISSDVRDLLKSDNKTAREAIDLFCYRASREIGSLTVTLTGCDAIVFTAGIGENAPIIRKKITERLEWMGLQLDDTHNEQNKTIISHQNSKIIVAVIPTNEAYMIAKHTLSLIKEL